MNERFDLLIEKYLEGALPPRERSELQRMLARDAGLRAEYVTRVTEEAALRSVLREGARGLAAPRRIRRPAPPSRPWLGWSFASAAAILLVLAIALRPSAPPPSPVARDRGVLPHAPLPEKSAPTPLPPEPPKPPRVEEPPVPPPVFPAPPDPAPVLPPEPAPPRPPDPPVPPARPLETVAALAKVLESSGEVSVKSGEGVLKGQPVRTGGAGSRALLALTDGTRIELGPDTTLTEMQEADAAARRGWRLTLAGGTAVAQVSRQEFPMVFATPHGEATVLGTTLRLAIDGSRTRLEVIEGRVRLSAGGRSTLVTAGQYAAASPGSLTAAKALPRNLLSDPGFELNARGWTPGDGGKGLGASPARARTGSRSLQIQGDSQTYRWASQFVRVTPGETYEISVWIWKDDVSAGGAEVKWVDAAGRIMPGPGDLPAPGPGQGWVLISDRRTVPAGAVQARLQLFSRSPSASFDDASFTAVLP